MPRPTLVFLALLPVLVVALFRVDFLGLNTRAQEFLHVQPHQDVATSGPNGKPPIIMATVSQWTHIEKFCQLASGLVALGYPVTFMGGTLFREHIEKTGATWFEVPGEPTVPGYWLPDAEFEKFLSYEPPSEKASAYGFGKLIWGAVPRYYPALQTALRKVGDYRTIWLHDTIVMASAPLQLGAPGIRPHTDIGVNAVPVCLSSNDTMPFNTGLVPDNSANSKEIHFQAWQAAENSYIMSSWGEHSIKGFAEVGAKLPPPTPAVDVGLVLPDILCPMTIPDFDFPRSDIRPNVRYIGMTKTVNTTVKALPSWWNEIEEAKAKGKKVVAVSRSSIDLLLENIIVPTMNGLAHRDDVIVAIALVNSEVKDFKKQYNVPANARVAKFIPMDLMLPYVRFLHPNVSSLY